MIFLKFFIRKILNFQKFPVEKFPNLKNFPPKIFQIKKIFRREIPKFKKFTVEPYFEKILSAVFKNSFRRKSTDLKHCLRGRERNFGMHKNFAMRIFISLIHKFISKIKIYFKIY